MGVTGARTVDAEQRKQLWEEVGIEDEHTDEEPHPAAEYLEKQDPDDEDGLKLPPAEHVLETGEYICNADRIDKKPHITNENIWWRNSKGDFVVETIEQKGHKYRDMAVYRDHGIMPEPDRVWNQSMEQLFERAVSQIENDPEMSNDLALFIGLNNIPDHHHVVVSDIEAGTGEPLEDLRKLDNFALYDLSADYSIDEPEYFEIGDVRGERGLKPYIT